MPSDRPAVPAEQEALDKPWRIWASVAVVIFTLVSLVLGFVIVPKSDEPGFNPFAAICRAIGIPGFEREDAGAVAAPSAAPVSAVAWTAETRRLLAAADAGRGEVTAQEICVSCHGEDGIGIDPTYPNLTHQSREAIFKQLIDYKNLSRKGGQAEIMSPMVMMLDRQQMADVAVYYASREARKLTQAGTAVSLPIGHLAKLGDTARGLASCDSCHGTSRSGPDGTPVLLGQSAPYLEQQLQLFASGERDNDLFARMRVIADKLTPEEMRGLAIYYGGKPAR